MPWQIANLWVLNDTGFDYANIRVIILSVFLVNDGDAAQNAVLEEQKAYTHNERNG